MDMADLVKNDAPEPIKEQEEDRPWEAHGCMRRDAKPHRASFSVRSQSLPDSSRSVQCQPSCYLSLRYSHWLWAERLICLPDTTCS